MVLPVLAEPSQRSTSGKRRRLARAALSYLGEHGLEYWIRFDVLTLEARRGRRWRIELCRNAFEAPDHL